MTHRVAFLSASAIACIAALGWASWLLLTGPLAHLMHSRFETLYGVFVILLVAGAIVTGALVGAWDVRGEQPHPRPHHHFHFRTLFHH